MHLNCPSCETRFVIDPAALDPSGRKVRCGRCGHAWHADPGAAEATDLVLTIRKEEVCPFREYAAKAEFDRISGDVAESHIRNAIRRRLVVNYVKSFHDRHGHLPKGIHRVSGEYALSGLSNPVSEEFDVTFPEGAEDDLDGD